jgi:hypothetical protein
VSGAGSRSEVNPVEPAPSERGLGAGAPAEAGAGGAPTARVKCESYYYRNTIKTGAKTRYYLVDVDAWEVLKPSRRERSKTGAHGEDIYCLEPEKWRNIIVVALKRSNSGKLSYEVIAPPGLEKYKGGLEELLRTASSFSEMEEAVETWVKAHYLARVFG